MVVFAAFSSLLFFVRVSRPTETAEDHFVGFFAVFSFYRTIIMAAQGKAIGKKRDAVSGNYRSRCFFFLVVTPSILMITAQTPEP